MTLPHDLQRRLDHAAARLGRFIDLEWHAEVGSTSDEAMARADAGAPEGLVVLADTQTAGRGRQGRHWISPPGAGIYLSVLLRPTTLTPIFTLAAGVAAADAVEAATGFRPALKWPNDVCVVPSQGPVRKLGGILAEGRPSPSDRAGVLVIGVGINVRGAAFPPDLAGSATSLEEELGRPVERDDLIVELLVALWRRYEEVRAGRTAPVLEAWRQRAVSTFGRRIEWQAGGGIATGVIDALDDSGALIVRTGGGHVRIVSGEIRWMP